MLQKNVKKVKEIKKRKRSVSISKLVSRPVSAATASVSVPVAASPAAIAATTPEWSSWLVVCLARNVVFCVNFAF